MKCHVLNRQSGGKVAEIVLHDMVCDQAGICRRRGICVLSDQSGLRIKGIERLPDHKVGINGPVYLALAFDNSIGFFWKEFPSDRQARRAAVRTHKKYDAPLIIKQEMYLEIKPDGVASDEQNGGISDPLTAQELARRITRDLVKELEDEELSDVEKSFPSLRSKIEFSRDCYLKMINDTVTQKRDFFDNYFRHHLIERLIKNMSGSQAFGGKNEDSTH